MNLSNCNSVLLDKSEVYIHVDHLIKIFQENIDRVNPALREHYTQQEIVDALTKFKKDNL